MKKLILIMGSIMMILAAIVICVGFYTFSTPEYALKCIIEDVNVSGMRGLDSHLTGKAKKTLDTVYSIKENDFFNTIVDLIDQDNFVSVLKSEIQNVQWEIDDILRSKEKSTVILLFNCKDKLIGTIEISMIREKGEWKIDGIEFPKLSEVNW